MKHNACLLNWRTKKQRRPCLRKTTSTWSLNDNGLLKITPMNYFFKLEAKRNRDDFRCIKLNATRVPQWLPARPVENHHSSFLQIVCQDCKRTDVNGSAKSPADDQNCESDNGAPEQVAQLCPGYRTRAVARYPRLFRKTVQSLRCISLSFLSLRTHTHISLTMIRERKIS